MDAFEPDDMTPTFIDEVEETFYAEVLLGDELRRFLESDLGRTLRGMATQDRNEAAFKMLEVKPDDVKTIQELQFQARCAENFTNYLAELFNRSALAEQQLKDYRQ
jgi:hypothetical protein